MTSSGAEHVSRLILDTSAFSHMRHGHPMVLDFVAAAGAVLIPATVLGELEAGFELGSRLRENRVVLQEFLEESFVATLDVTPSVARRYGGIFAHLRRTGTPIPVNDIWIAASALETGGHLLTFDDDFRRVPGLDCTVLE